MTMTISSLRGGAATALDTIAAIRTVYDYIPDTAPATPSAIVGNVSIEWDDANARGLDAATFSVYVVVSRTLWCGHARQSSRRIRRGFGEDRARSGRDARRLLLDDESHPRNTHLA
jgi:hypothetical protein